MFSKYDEIAKIIRDYIEESLTKPMMEASLVNSKLQELYGISLSEMDITNLTAKINLAKKCRSDYNIGVQHSFASVNTASNSLDQAKEIAILKESEAREYAYTLATKVCIMLYKGPLTIDTMKELKERGYNGTYGNTTMMQMYALYTEKQRLEQNNSEQKAIISQKDKEIDAYRQTYTQQFQVLRQEQITSQTIKEENNRLQLNNQSLMETLKNQGQMIQMLTEKVENLSKKIPIQITEFLKPLFGNKVDATDHTKTMH